MTLLKRGRAEEEPEIRRDFSDIAQTYGFTPEEELEPDQELILFGGLGLTALRATDRNPEYEFFSRRMDESSASDKATRTAS